MLSYKIYHRFLYHIVSGNILLPESRHITNEFYTQHLRNDKFKWEGTVTRAQEEYFHKVLLELSGQLIKALQEIQRSEGHNELSGTINFLLKFSKLVSNEELNKDLNKGETASTISFEIDFLPPYPPIIKTPPTIPFVPKTEFYFRLIKNLSALILNQAYEEFLLQNLDEKDRVMSFIYSDLFYGMIGSSYKEVSNEKYKWTAAWSETITSDSYKNYIIRFCGYSVVWIYGELKELFELEFKSSAKPLEFFYRKYDFAPGSINDWSINLTYLSERVVNRIISSNGYNRSIVFNVIGILRSRYNFLNRNDSDPKVIGECRRRLVILIYSLENFIFLKEFLTAQERLKINFEALVDERQIKESYDLFKKENGVNYEQGVSDALIETESIIRSLSFVDLTMNICEFENAESIPRRLLKEYRLNSDLLKLGIISAKEILNKKPKKRKERKNTVRSFESKLERKELIELIHNYIEFLKSDVDSEVFENLNENLLYTILDRKLPSRILKVPKIKRPNGLIQYTIGVLFIEAFPDKGDKKKKELVAEFLINQFTQFKDVSAITIIKKFPGPRPPSIFQNAFLNSKLLSEKMLVK